MTQIVIVDDNDIVIGLKDRSEIKSLDIYRVSALWVVNNEGDVLLAQRAFNKKNNPGKWGPAVRDFGKRTFQKSRKVSR